LANVSSCPPSGGSGQEDAAVGRTLPGMNLQPHDTDSHVLDPHELAPVTGEHRVRPPVTLDAEPPQGVPVWEPEAGDYS
jgi:hypothetical protein